MIANTHHGPDNAQRALVCSARITNWLLIVICFHLVFHPLLQLRLQLLLMLDSFSQRVLSGLFAFICRFSLLYFILYLIFILLHELIFCVLSFVSFFRWWCLCEFSVLLYPAKSRFHSFLLDFGLRSQFNTQQFIFSFAIFHIGI